MPSTTDERLLKAQEAALYLAVSLRTLHEIERLGLLVPLRTPGGHRRYTHTMLNRYLNARLVAHPTKEL